jgi:hypothetical protein
MTTYITNSFSINMLDVLSADVRFETISAAEVSAALQELETVWGVIAENAIGHPDIDRIARDQIRWMIPGQRVTLSVGRGDILYVCQYRGPRLPEGATELPEGADIEWWRVTVA